VGLLFVLGLGNRIVSAFGRSLVGRGLGALFELLVVLSDDAVIVDLHRGEHDQQQKDDTGADHRELGEAWRDTDSGGERE
jgi:hypothetical protein